MGALSRVGRVNRSCSAGPCFHYARLPRGLAHLLTIYTATVPTGVPHPCVFCKGGWRSYRRNLCPFCTDPVAYEFVVPALRKVREGRGTLFISSASDQGWATRRGKKAYMQYEAQLTVAIGRLGTLREDLKAAQAAITGALANVEINLTSLKDEAFAADVRRRISFRPPATTK